jgi:CRISPR-associated protein Csd1
VILQALYEYYQRKAADPESGISPNGFEPKEIPFVIVIDREGRFVALEDTRSGEGKKKRARRFTVPQKATRTVGIQANLLWDNLEYCVGANPRDRDDIERRAQSFRDEIISSLPAREENWRVDTLLRFLEQKPAEVLALGGGELWQEALGANANATFRIDGDEFPLLIDAFREHIGKKRAQGAGGRFCLVSGDVGPIEKTHPLILGVRGGKPTGGAIVSFNEHAYTSYGKAQNFNAPVSSQGTFAYTMALNTLLGRDSKNRMQVGDATTVFWSERPTQLDETFADFFAMAPKDDPDRDVQAVRSLYDSINSGALEIHSTTGFYVLGLAPNAARISIRFWQVGTVREFSERLRQHFDDMALVRPAADKGRCSLFWLLVDLANEGKVDNLPPNLGGDIVRAILAGQTYPAMLMQQAVRRIRAERTVTPMRASALKAYLNRFHRTHNTSEKEITVSLDQENENIGYRLGRLFAVLEKIQEDANPGLNATIRDRYYGAASANPTTAFPQLLKLKNHHLKKIDRPARVGAHEKRLTEIFGGIPTSLPHHLRMEDQARFAIGYYHQRQALYTKGDKGNGGTPSPALQDQELS